jgi:predicted O-methyltransferase YrrM
MEPVKDIVNPVRMTSEEAVKLYEDNTLDFVLIDGSHEYELVKKDLINWLAKLKPGAMLAGDDYEWPGVKQAVNELLPGFTHMPVIGCWVYFKP